MACYILLVSARLVNEYTAAVQYALMSTAPGTSTHLPKPVLHHGDDQQALPSLRL